MRLKLFGCVALLLAPAAVGQEAPGGPHLYSLDEAVAVALSHNPRLKVTRLQESWHRDAAHAARGHLLPAVKLGASYDYVRANEGLSFAALTPGGMNPNTPTPPPYRINFWGGDASVTVAQPLLGLFHLSQDAAADASVANAAGADVQTGEDELRAEIEYGYLSLFEARAEEGIAKASEAQLGEQLTVAQAKFKDGALTHADVLRFQVAAANAAQQGLQAKVQEENARDQLLGLLGLAGAANREAVDFGDPTDTLSRRPLPSQSDDLEAAFAQDHRPELSSALFTSDAAWHRKQARYLELLPELTASYSYYRLLNTPAAFPSDIELVGFSASWNLWDFGATYYAAHAAGEQFEAAAANHEAVRQQVAVEVRTRQAQERAAASAIQVASETIAQAEEAFRVTEATVRAGAATTTDLLDAQAALTQARLNLIRSKYEELRARSALFRALGSGRG